MACNNEVTYHEKWDTLENNACLKTLDNKFFDRSICWPSCPVSWAPEVLDLLERINDQYGIARNTETIRAYRIEHSLFTLFVTAPLNNAKYNLFKRENLKGNKIEFRERVSRMKHSLIRDLKYARTAFMVKYANGLLNKILRPKVTLDQIKEKYGYLTVYFSCDPEYKEHIDKMVYETIVKLALKGAYYPIETVRKNEQETV